MYYDAMLAMTQQRQADDLEKYQKLELKESGKTRKEFFSDIHQAYRRTTIKYIRACVAELEAKMEAENPTTPQ